MVSFVSIRWACVSLLALWFLIGLLLPTDTSAFQPLSMGKATPRVMTATQSSANANAIFQIQEDYRLLRERLQQSLAAGKQEIDPIAFTEEMLDKASDLAALQRYQQNEILSQAQKELRHARQDHVLADAIQQQAHIEYMLAKEQADLLEGFEDKDGYEDLERLRDMSVAHAESQLEHDAKELSLESQFLELEAEEKQDRAIELLLRLGGIEKELKETMKALKKYKNEKAMEEWIQQEAPKHEAFINNMKMELSTIDHDPFKGNVAF
jgi:hypothetical protein